MCNETGNKKQKIVIVNSSHADPVDVSCLLKEDGYKVTAFSSVKVALDSMENQDVPDLIITDLYMSGIDGWRFCRLLRSEEYSFLNKVPLLVVSHTFARANVERLVLDLGADAFLPMPINEETLLNAVATLLTGKSIAKLTRVLAVEDSLVSRTVLKNIFDTGQYELNIATSGEEARRLFSEHDPHLILLDYHLPDVNGTELLEEFRAEAPDAAIIIVTADTDPELALTIMRKGANAYIRKPFLPEYVRTVCENTIRENNLIRIEATLESNAEIIRETEDRYRNLFNRMLDGFFLCEVICDDDGRLQDFLVLDINAAMEEFSGLKLGKIFGVSISTIWPTMDRSWIEAIGSVALTGEATRFTKYSQLMKRHFDVLAYSPQANQVACLMKDVTLEQELKKEREQNQKLKAVGQLAGGIAHDFNNILMSLFGNISLATAAMDENQPGYSELKSAEDAMAKATRLTGQLLTFATGGDPIKEDLRIGALVEQSVNFDLSGSNVQLVLKQDENLLAAKVDRGQIQQVLSNLTLNAREAMPNGGHLFITIENADILPETALPLQPGQYIKLTLRDEGGGIEPQHLEHIFELYYTTRQTGRGLGLATSYSIIDKHKGHIGVESVPGKGATFTIYLPAAENQPLLTAAREPEATVSLERAKKVLIMDDDAMICKVVTKMLERSGYIIETAPDGEQAIEMYKQAMETENPFDAIVMDLTIPGGMGGQEAIKYLLEIDPDVRAVVSSGYAIDPVMANYVEYGFKGIAGKPYSKSAITEVLDRVLSE